MVALRLTAAPTTEPLSVSDAKAHLNYTADDKDDDISAYISVARAACEVETNRAFLAQDWALTLDRFPGLHGIIEIPRPPLQSILSIAYTDTDGNAQTLSSEYYQVDSSSEPGRLAPARDCKWPDTDSEKLGAVVISFRAGWAAAANVPVEITHAIKLLVSHYFWNLSATAENAPRELPFAVQMLLAHCKIPVIA